MVQLDPGQSIFKRQSNTLQLVHLEEKVLIQTADIANAINSERGVLNDYRCCNAKNG